MSEKVVIFNGTESSQPKSVERADFYSHRYTLYNDYYIYLIDLFLITSTWQILLQKRARNKKNSPWQLHTSVWWHVNDNEAPAFTLLHESIEELWVPCYLVPDWQNYASALKKLWTYTNRIALVKHHKDYYRTLEQYTDPAWRSIDAKDRVYLCFGIYDWPIQCLDHSSDWFEYFDITTLKQELKKHPLLFTTTLHNFLDELWDEIQTFIDEYCVST